jgi:hypothetical protein
LSEILKEFKAMEKSIADSIDKLGYVDPSKIEQFTDLTYTEVANISYLLTRADMLKRRYFPFTENIDMPGPKGTTIQKTVPLTYKFGQSLEQEMRTYMQLKISMGRKSRMEVRGVATSFGSGAQEQRQSFLGRAWGKIKGVGNSFG